MSACRAQHDDHSGHDHHGHDHGGHGGHGHDHDHDHSDDVEPALKHSLYQVVHFDHIVTLNEQRRDQGRRVVEKTWADRMDTDVELVSDADEQLLMTVPYVTFPGLLF
jgi:hypothetical protein